MPKKFIKKIIRVSYPVKWAPYLSHLRLAEKKIRVEEARSEGLTNALTIKYLKYRQAQDEFQKSKEEREEKKDMAKKFANIRANLAQTKERLALTAQKKAIQQ